MKKNICDSGYSENCGTNLNLDNIRFSGKEPNLVYIDKVFSNVNASSCPLIFNLNTACNDDNFTVTFNARDCVPGCQCSPCPINRNSVFNIENSYVEIEYLETCPPGNIGGCQVVIGGGAVNNVIYENGRYKIDDSDIASRVQNEKCMSEGLPTKVFFLLRNICGWAFRATFVVEGTVNTEGRTCCFRARFKNNINSSPIPLPAECCTNFAVPDLAIPSSLNGDSPEISFRFGGRAKLVNPKLKVKCNSITPMKGGGPCHDHNPVEECSLSLQTTVVIEPAIHVQVVRKSLFMIDAKEGIFPRKQIEDNEISLRELCRQLCTQDQGDRCDYNKHKDECYHTCDNHSDQCSQNDKDDECIYGCDHHRSCSDTKAKTPYYSSGCNGCTW